MAQKYRSPFAQAMSYYSGHIRQQTQMAFQEAARQMQSEQASELAQRQYLMDRLKLEYSLLNGLRKQKTQLKKQISKTGASPQKLSEFTGLSNAYTRAQANYLEARDAIDEGDIKSIEKFDKAFFIQPDIRAAIDTYTQKTNMLATQLSSNNNIAIHLGTSEGGNVDSNNAEELIKLQKAFAKIPQDELGQIQRRRAFDYLIIKKHDMLGNPRIKGKRLNEARDELEAAYKRGVSAWADIDRLSEEESNTQYTDRINGLGIDPDVAASLRGLQNNAARLDTKINNWGNENNVTPVEMSEIKDTIGQTTGSIGDTQKRITELTSKLDKPKVSTGPQTLSERAGNILFKNELQKIANDRMKQALKNMPDEEKQFYKYYKRAEELSNKGIPDHGDGLDHSGTKKAIDTYIKDYDPNKTTNTNILKDYLNYQKGLEIPEQFKDEMTIRGIARIFDTVKGAVQENEKFKKQIENSFKPKTESKTESKINDLPGPLPKDANLSDTSDNIETGHRFERTFTRTRNGVVTSKKYYYEFTGLDANGNPKFKYIDPNGRRKDPNPAQLQEALQLYNRANR
jgi:hypothetical protein